MKKLQDKVAVFVGGGSAVATIALKHFMDEGAKVLLVDVDEKYFDRSRQLRDEYRSESAPYRGVHLQGDMSVRWRSQSRSLAGSTSCATTPDSTEAATLRRS